MKLGIVGSEEAKFTWETYHLACMHIGTLIERYKPEAVVSGECHLGGIDQWARQEAELHNVPFIGHPPANLNWSTGYKPRNIKIAEDSDLVVCITVKELPPDYKGMVFPLCYHCGTKDHVKSGGCWTVKYAKKIGKEGQIIVI